MFGVELILWIMVGIICYTYVGFPLLVAVTGKILHRRVRKESITPTISLIIAAHNEEQSIAAKLDNALKLDYPPDALEIVVVSDGSNDNTNSIVADYAQEGVKLMELPRGGKITALNLAAAQANGEILVLTDANTFFSSQALRELAANFADPEVGGVCGNQLYSKMAEGDVTSKGETHYWNYDKWLKKMQSQTGSIVSADGAIWAVRRILYRTLLSKDVTDDFAISTSVIEQGFRLVFDEDAVVHELPMSSAGAEFTRKVRIINCGLRGVLLRKALLNPFSYGFYSVVLFSHKVLRRLIPFALLMIFATSIWLSYYKDIYGYAVLAQCGFYIAAMIGYLLKKNRVGRLKFFYIPFYYCLANAAAFIAVLQVVTGKRIAMWNPERQS